LVVGYIFQIKFINIYIYIYIYYRERERKPRVKPTTIDGIETKEM